MSAPDTPKKHCTNCGGPGPFGPRTGTSDGLKSQCRKCCAEKQRAYAAAHPETWKDWSANNTAHLRARDATRYAADPEAAKARTRSWQLANPEKFKANCDRGNLVKYGITPEEKRALFDKQEGKCPICTAPLLPGRKGMQVDHDHETGVVRGLLCALCNSMLGDFRKEPAWLQAAVLYLRHGPVTGLTPTQRPSGVGYKSRGTRAGNLWYNYGLTDRSFQELLDRQGGCCADPPGGPHGRAGYAHRPRPHPRPEARAPGLALP